MSHTILSVTVVPFPYMFKFVSTQLHDGQQRENAEQALQKKRKELQETTEEVNCSMLRAITTIHCIYKCHMCTKSKIRPRVFTFTMTDMMPKGMNVRIGDLGRL